MLISHKHKFITIDIPKTGSRSTRTALQPQNVIDIVGEPRGVRFRQHGTAEEAFSGFQKERWDFDDYFKFSIVRNPWNRYFSFLTYYKTKIKHYQETKGTLNENQERQKKFILNFSNGRTDLQMLTNIIKNSLPQKKYLINSNGDVVMDQIGQLENIENDFVKFCKNVGILPIAKFKHENKSSVKNISKHDIYTQELIDMVAEKEKWVINKFRYIFT
jgi:hypothetical protein